MMRKFLIGAATLGLVSAPAFAATSNQPVTLSDQQLDNVVGGQSLLGLEAYVNLTMQNVNVSVDVSNVPVNAALAMQLNALGSAQQVSSVTAYQQVTQVAAPG
jgi:hypothetical protein